MYNKLRHESLITLHNTDYLQCITGAKRKKNEEKNKKPIVLVLNYSVRFTKKLNTPT